MQAEKRAEAVRHAEFLIDHKTSIGYPGVQPDGTDVAFRPVPWIEQSLNGLAKRFAAGEIWYPDCSGSIDWIARWSGWKTPTGFAWGLGGSADMWNHLGHYASPKGAKTGALITYGQGGGIHVAMVIEPDPVNPWLFSHGSAAGPIKVRYLDENAAHAGQLVTFLDVSPLLR